MRVEAVFEDVPYEIKKLLKKWVEAVTEAVEADEVYSNTASFDGREFYYSTASGKGEYTVDFSQRGRITVKFEGYRNSLRGGTPYFSLIPHFYEPHQLKCTVVFIIAGPMGAVHRIELFGECKIETSKPEKPLFSPDEVYF